MNKWEKFYRNSRLSPQELGDTLLETLNKCLRGICETEQISGLIDAGADLKVRDDLGRTPLFIAVCSKNTVLADILIAATIKGGYSFDVETTFGLSPVRYMMTRYPMAPGNIDRLIRMFDHGASPHLPDRSQVTPLMVAAESGAERLVRYLVSRDADLAAKDIRGKTAEDMARAAFNKEIADFLKGERNKKEKLRRYIENGLPATRKVQPRKFIKKPPKR